MIPRTRKIRKITRNTKNSTFAMLAAPAAMSVKPSAAATSEMRKKSSATDKAQPNQGGRPFTFATNARTSGMISGSSARTAPRVMPGRTRG